MNQEERMRKKWLPKQPKKTEEEKNAFIDWNKTKYLIIGLVIGIILLVIIWQI